MEFGKVNATSNLAWGQHLNENLRALRIRHAVRMHVTVFGTGGENGSRVAKLS